MEEEPQQQQQQQPQQLQPQQQQQQQLVDKEKKETVKREETASSNKKEESRKEYIHNFSIQQTDSIPQNVTMNVKVRTCFLCASARFPQIKYFLSKNLYLRKNSLHPKRFAGFKIFLKNNISVPTSFLQLNLAAPDFSFVIFKRQNLAVKAFKVVC